MLCVPHTNSILCGYVIQSVGYISLCSLIVPCEMSSPLPLPAREMDLLLGVVFGWFLLGLHRAPRSAQPWVLLPAGGWVLGIAH